MRDFRNDSSRQSWHIFCLVCTAHWQLHKYGVASASPWLRKVYCLMAQQTRFHTFIRIFDYLQLVAAVKYAARIFHHHSPYLPQSLHHQSASPAYQRRMGSRSWAGRALQIAEAAACDRGSSSPVLAAAAVNCASQAHSSTLPMFPSS